MDLCIGGAGGAKSTMRSFGHRGAAISSIQLAGGDVYQAKNSALSWVVALLLGRRSRGGEFILVLDFGQ